MIADTTFLTHYFMERTAGQRGPARTFFASHRSNDLIRTTAINLGEIAILFEKSSDAWQFFERWTVYPLRRGIVDAAADVDREMIRLGGRLGENDDWIAGFAL